jgi:hypothetical protein
MSQNAPPHQARAVTFRFNAQENRSNVPSTADRRTKVTVRVTGSRTIEAGDAGSKRMTAGNLRSYRYGNDTQAILYPFPDVQNSAMRRIGAVDKNRGGSGALDRPEAVILPVTDRSS